MQSMIQREMIYDMLRGRNKRITECKHRVKLNLFSWSIQFSTKWINWMKQKHNKAREADTSKKSWWIETWGIVRWSNELVRAVSVNQRQAGGWNSHTACASPSTDLYKFSFGRGSTSLPEKQNEMTRVLRAKLNDSHPIICDPWLRRPRHSAAPRSRI